MPATTLTNRFCESVKPTPKKQIAYPDALVRGLELRVSGDGRKSWSLRYRSFDGRQSRLSLGVFPAVDLAAARSAALGAVANVAQGGDPASKRRAARHQASSAEIKTFGDLAEAYLKACEAGLWTPKGKRQRPRTIADSRGVWTRYVRPRLGNLRVPEVTRSAIRALLRDLVAKGIEAQTKRTHAFIRQVFAWAIAEFDDDFVPYNPAVGFPALGRVKPRLRVYNDTELRALWAALAAPETLRLQTAKGETTVGVSRSMTLIIQLAAVLLQRKSEVAGMHESELDLINRTWLIPGERMKGGWPQLVPLSPLAITLIEEAKRLRREEDEAEGRPPSNQLRLIFPSRKDPEAPVRGDSVTHAMGDICKAIGLKNATVHDLRRTGSTMMTSERLKVMPFIRSKVLGHRNDAGGGAAVSVLHYDANEYVSEKRQALEAWADLLIKIVSAQEPLRQAA